MKSDGAQTFDVAIIGGGIIGLSCAWKMAARGARVVVFERSQTGREASYAAAGMLAPSCESAVHPWHCSEKARDAMLDLCFASRDLFPVYARQLLEETGLDIELLLEGGPTSDWREPGILFVPPREEDPRLDVLLEDGVITTYHQKPAVFLPKDGQVETRKLEEAVRAAALSRGVHIREGRPVHRLEIEAGQVTGVVTEHEVTNAKKVLLSAGSWSGQIEGVPAEIAASIRPLAGQMLQLRGDHLVSHVIYSDGCYLVPRRDGRLLLGATVEEVGFQKRVTAGGVAKLLTAACALVPELRDVTLEAQWAGLRPATPDGLPMLGPTALENLFVATGHGRNGILLSPATAEAITAAMLDNRSIPAAFSPARFPPPT
jgi:glycine oxidase